MNSYISFEDNMARMFTGLAPVDIKGQSNRRAKYNKKYLYTKLCSKFKFDFGTTPVDLNTFRYGLLFYGVWGVFKKDNLVFLSPYAVEKYNMYFNPYEIVSTGLNEDLDINLNGLKGIVGKNAAVIKCFDNYTGFIDLLNDYSNKLAEFDKTVSVALSNANVNLLGFACSKKEADELRTAYAAATEGEPLIVLDRSKEPTDKKDLLVPFTNHDTASLLDRLLTARRAVLNQFLTDIGINNANIDKKERLNSDEVNANNEELEALISVIYENIKEGFEQVNKVFGLNWSVELNQVEESDTAPEVTEKEVPENDV